MPDPGSVRAGGPADRRRLDRHRPGALGDLDIEIVATLDSSQQRILRSAPANTRLVDFVPMHALLPTCAAVVHHGGAGTFLAANLYGVPQVTIPSLWETPMKGLMLEQANP